MNTPVLNVAAGNERRKALVQRLAQQAALRMQQQSGVSRFGRLGTQTNGQPVGYGKPKAIGRPLGAGIGGARGIGSGLNFTDAFRAAVMGVAPSGEQSGEQSPLAGVPADGNWQDTHPGIDPSDVFGPRPPSATQPGINPGDVSGGTTPGQQPGIGVPVGGGTPGPSSGLIPLGNGVYLDPSTGVVHGYALGGGAGGHQV